MCRVPHCPVRPVEDGPEISTWVIGWVRPAKLIVFDAWVRSEERHDGVDHGKDEGEQSDYGVGSTISDGTESVQIYGSKDKAHQGEDHCEAHQQPGKVLQSLAIEVICFHHL